MNHRSYVSIFLVGFLLGIIGYHFLSSNKVEHIQTVDSTVILEKIEAVSKMVTAEGTYSNIYPFKKQATIKVSIKALVGVDLSKMVINIDEKKKVIYLDNIPDVEPIGLDTRVDYFDMSEGTFNQFNKDDLNKINNMVRTLSEDAIDFCKSDSLDNKTKIFLNVYSGELNGFFKPLVKTAREQAYKQIMLIEFIARLTGWEVMYNKHHYIVQKFKG